MLRGLARPAIAHVVEQKSYGKCKRQRRQTCAYQRYTISHVNLMATYVYAYVRHFPVSCTGFRDSFYV